MPWKADVTFKIISKNGSASDLLLANKIFIHSFIVGTKSSIDVLARGWSAWADLLRT